MKSQASKRSRAIRKEALYARVHRLTGHPTHISSRDLYGWVKRNPLKTWGDIFRLACKRENDPAYAAWLADKWAKRIGEIS